MKTGTKNPNEYIEDGHRFIRSIRRCLCAKKVGNDYILNCKIHQHGNHDYEYQDGNSYIRKRFSNKTFWLSDEAKQSIISAVQAFDTIVKKTTINGSAPFSFSYTRRSPHRYDCVVSIIDKKNDKARQSIFTFEDKGIDWIIWQTGFSRIDYTSETIDENPFFKEAVMRNDRILQAQLKLCYRIADADDCSRLSNELNVAVLPTLPEAYNKNYPVDANTISFKLLNDSGYLFLHRPNIAMINCTRTKCQINPHTKCVVDAAPIEGESISFDTFLDLFSEAEITPQ